MLGQSKLLPSGQYTGLPKSVTIEHSRSSSSHKVIVRLKSSRLRKCRTLAFGFAGWDSSLDLETRNIARCVDVRAQNHAGRSRKILTSNTHGDDAGMSSKTSWTRTPVSSPTRNNETLLRVHTSKVSTSATHPIRAHPSRGGTIVL